MEHLRVQYGSGHVEDDDDYDDDEVGVVLQRQAMAHLRVQYGSGHTGDEHGLC